MLRRLLFHYIKVSVISFSPLSEDAFTTEAVQVNIDTLRGFGFLNQMYITLALK